VNFVIPLDVWILPRYLLIQYYLYIVYFPFCAISDASEDDDPSDGLQGNLSRYPSRLEISGSQSSSSSS
jgi:hypothetical protein